MFNRQSLHIALLLWGCIFSLLAQQLTCAVLLASDALAWGWRRPNVN